MPNQSGNKIEKPGPARPDRAQGSLAGTILAAFDVACDAREHVVAAMLLRTLEGVLAARADGAGVQAVLTVAKARLRNLEQDELP